MVIFSFDQPGQSHFLFVLFFIRFCNPFVVLQLLKLKRAKAKTEIVIFITRILQRCGKFLFLAQKKASPSSQSGRLFKK